MLKKSIIAAIALFMTSGTASATEYAYLIDHGTPGVISSESKMARIVIQGSGDCSNIPYEIITDGVKSLSGTMNLSKPLSLPLDLTTVNLSCNSEGVTAKINRKGEGLF
ncbi:hypothetical protein Ga0123462_0659 [Mariprofundus ferrinatatus]|uniref:Uncharacterized protein n=1 Tax=Mariprofundus ferrinatatus TaxID=1921087 RepID=A0A2K8L5L1_9PROT|nr:hypothetical protein [Mariprofundus ferrinatatus]ATX81529.1 hypothetical protein Ga0123462_0659 [Mariprofundus ferrinatatus]